MTHRRRFSMTLFLPEDGCLPRPRLEDRGSHWHPLPVFNAPCGRIGEIQKKSLMNIKAVRKVDPSDMKKNTALATDSATVLERDDQQKRS